jgi:hypothetical protein
MSPGTHWFRGRSGLRGEEKILDPTGTRTPTPPSSALSRLIVVKEIVNCDVTLRGVVMRQSDPVVRGKIDSDLALRGVSCSVAVWYWC